MADIGGFNKITNLWPAHRSRPIDGLALRKKRFQDHHNEKQNKENDESGKTGPGTNIDEYA